MLAGAIYGKIYKRRGRNLLRPYTGGERAVIIPVWGAIYCARTQETEGA